VNKYAYIDQDTLRKIAEGIVRQHNEYEFRPLTKTTKRIILKLREELEEVVKNIHPSEDSYTDQLLNFDLRIYRQIEVESHRTEDKIFYTINTIEDKEL
jgi:hypothetical protein